MALDYDDEFDSVDAKKLAGSLKDIHPKMKAFTDYLDKKGCGFNIFILPRGKDKGDLNLALATGSAKMTALEMIAMMATFMSDPDQLKAMIAAGIMLRKKLVTTGGKIGGKNSARQAIDQVLTKLKKRRRREADDDDED